MKKIVQRTTRLKKYFSDDIWSIDHENLSKAKARFVKYMKVLMLTIKTFSGEKIGFQAVALSFFSTMSVVPFIAVIFAVTGGLGLADRLMELLYNYFDNSQETIDMVLGFAQNIIETASSSTIGLISALLFVWLVIWLMLSVERVFNNVWKVRKSRNIFRRLSITISMLIISPFVVLVFFSGSVAYSHILEFIGLNLEEFTLFKTILTWTIFAVMATLTFSAMYKFIPNAPVRFYSALKAAVPAAIAFSIVQYMYLETQVFVTRMNAIYGAFAAVPLFMFWLNTGWYIILIGAELSYAFQNVDNYNLED